MSTTLAVDRSRLCTHTFENGAKCRIPLSPGHSCLCTFHARKEAEDRAADEAVRDIAFPLSARYVSFCGLSSAIANTITAVAYNHISTRTAATIAYLTQNLVQSVAGAEKEYIAAFGAQAWRQAIADNFNAPRPADEPARPASPLLLQPSSHTEQAHHEIDPQPDPQTPTGPYSIPPDATFPAAPSHPEVEAALEGLRRSLETR